MFPSDTHLLGKQQSFYDFELSNYRKRKLPRLPPTTPSQTRTAPWREERRLLFQNGKNKGESVHY